jgi:glycosyltransferase involved in cell wall biosynthesis
VQYSSRFNKLTMRILLALQARLPVLGYGGPERIIWWLGKQLAKRGHKITFLCAKESSCDFGSVRVWDPKLSLPEQIGRFQYDLVHFHQQCDLTGVETPHLTTLHSNIAGRVLLHPNTVFLSAHHAKRHGGEVYVHNGLDFEDYGTPVIEMPRKYFHFLGKAAWREKNLRGALDLTHQLGERLHVLGGTRLGMRNQPMAMLSTHARFHGMVGGDGKNILINGSKGLVFPVLWHEPFGLTVIESLYFGCPVFGTPYGALPEVLTQKKPSDSTKNGTNGGRVDAVYSDYGVLSVKKAEILEAMRHAGDFNAQKCHDFVRANYSAEQMTEHYLDLYRKVGAGQPLHEAPLVVPDQGSNKLLPLL